MASSPADVPLCVNVTRDRREPQASGGIFSFWPGKILFGSFRTSLFASKIRGHLAASPYSCLAILERLSPDLTSWI